MNPAKKRLAGLCCVLTVTFLGCVPQARVIPFSSVPEFARPAADRINDYPEALATIMSVMVEELKLPNVDISLFVYENAKDFRSGLIKELGMDPVLASQMAGFAGGVGSARKVLINEVQLDRHPWPERVKLLAHELTHCVEYSYAKGHRGTSDQWLREGFADWVSYKVIDNLGMDTYARRRRMRLDQVKRAQKSKTFPTLTQMVTLQDWVAWRDSLGNEATYAQAFLAVEYLIERKSLRAVVEYFRLFDRSNDRVANFVTAFDENITEFDEQFGRHLAASLADGPLVVVH